MTGLSHPFRCALASAAIFFTALGAHALDVESATIADIDAAFAKGTLTSEKLTEIYLARIAAYDKQGPALNAVMTPNPNALAEAKALDAERRAGKVRGPLHGIPIVLKDNYNTFDLPTTAGSQLLAGSIPPDDAFVVAKLRKAGVVILAKVNMSEFAAGGGSVGGATDPAVIKAAVIPNGFSSMGLQTLNPHDLTRGPSGSSGGTGVSIAAAFAQFGLGTDTASSVRGPSSANGIVGLKTTMGLVSRSGVVPLALSFDTCGPMGRSVYDVAVALNTLAGVDPTDPSTLAGAGHHVDDYTQFLKVGSLKGVRIGIARDFTGRDAEVDRIVDESIVKLKELGAIIVENVRFPEYVLQARQAIFNTVRNTEFRAEIADYLKTLKPGYPRNLDELAEKANDPASGYRSAGKAFGLKYSVQHAMEIDDPVYVAAKTQGLALVKAGTEAVYKKYNLDVILYPTSPTPATLINPEPVTPTPGARNARADTGSASALNIANMSGFPDLVIPAGMTNNGLPVTISLLGPAFSEPKLLAYGYDFEQATHARAVPKYTPVLPGDTIGN